MSTLGVSLLKEPIPFAVLLTKLRFRILDLGLGFRGHLEVAKI